ncbi:titin-like [Coccinella septempunctata]|uniref:titin-like n=1 Tax=Coccinella septempunctata TaxID=41139 RepID=UPI001D0986BC|nr:titin-like [Coccinella septempunctata]
MELGEISSALEEMMSTNYQLEKPNINTDTSSIDELMTPIEDLTTTVRHFTHFHLKVEENFKDILDVEKSLDTTIPASTETTMSPFLLTEIPQISEKPFEVVTTLDELLASVPSPASYRAPTVDPLSIFDDLDNEVKVTVEDNVPSVSPTTTCKAPSVDVLSIFDNLDNRVKVSVENAVKAPKKMLKKLFEKKKTTTTQRTTTTTERERMLWTNQDEVMYPLDIETIKPGQEEEETVTCVDNGGQCDMSPSTTPECGLTAKGRIAHDDIRDNETEYYVDIVIPYDTDEQQQYIDRFEQEEPSYYNVLDNSRRVQREDADRKIWKEFKWPEHRKYQDSTTNRGAQNEMLVEETEEVSSSELGQSDSDDREIWKEFKFPEHRKYEGSITGSSTTTREIEVLTEDGGSAIEKTAKVEIDDSADEFEGSLTTTEDQIDAEDTAEDREIWKEFKWPDQKKYKSLNIESLISTERELEGKTADENVWEEFEWPENKELGSSTEKSTSVSDFGKNIWREFKWPEHKKYGDKVTTERVGQPTIKESQEFDEYGTMSFAGLGTEVAPKNTVGDYESELGIPEIPQLSGNSEWSPPASKVPPKLGGNTQAGPTEGSVEWSEFNSPSNKTTPNKYKYKFDDLPAKKKITLPEGASVNTAPMDEAEAFTDNMEKATKEVEGFRWLKKDKLPTSEGPHVMKTGLLEELRLPVHDTAHLKVISPSTPWTVESTTYDRLARSTRGEIGLWNRFQWPEHKKYVETVAITENVPLMETAIWNRMQDSAHVRLVEKTTESNKEAEIWRKFQWPGHNEYAEGRTTRAPLVTVENKEKFVEDSSQIIRTEPVKTTRKIETTESEDEVLPHFGGEKRHTTKIIEKSFSPEELTSKTYILEGSDKKTTTDIWEAFQWPPPRTPNPENRSESIVQGPMDDFNKIENLTVVSDTEGQQDKPDSSLDLFAFPPHDAKTEHDNNLTILDIPVPPFPPPEDYEEYSMLTSTDSSWSYDDVNLFSELNLLHAQDMSSTGRDTYADLMESLSLSPEGLFPSSESPTEAALEGGTTESDKKMPFWDHVKKKIHRPKTTTTEGFPTKHTSPPTKSTTVGEHLELVEDISYKKHHGPNTEPSLNGPIKIPQERTIHTPVKESEDDDSLWDFRVLSEEEVVTFHSKTKKPTHKKTTIFSFKPIETTADDWEVFNEPPKEEVTKPLTESTVAKKKTTFYVVITKPTESPEPLEDVGEKEKPFNLEPPPPVAPPGAVEQSTEYYDEEEGEESATQDYESGLEAILSKQVEKTTEQKLDTTEENPDVTVGKVEDFETVTFRVSEVFVERTEPTESEIGEGSEENVELVTFRPFESYPTASMTAVGESVQEVMEDLRERNREGFVDSLQLEQVTFRKSPVAEEKGYAERVMLDEESLSSELPKITLPEMDIRKGDKDNLLYVLTERSESDWDLVTGGKPSVTVSVGVGEGTTKIVEGDQIMTEPYDHRSMSVPFNEKLEGGADIIKEINKPNDPNESPPLPPLSDLASDFLREQSSLGRNRDPYSVLERPPYSEKDIAFEDRELTRKEEDQKAPFTEENVEEDYATALVEPDLLEPGPASEGEDSWKKSKHLLETSEGYSMLEKLKKKLTNYRAKPITAGGGNEEGGSRGKEFRVKDRTTTENGSFGISVTYPEAVEAVVAVERTTKTPETPVSKHEDHSTEKHLRTTHRTKDKFLELIDLESQLERAEMTESPIEEASTIPYMLTPIPDIVHGDRTTELSSSEKLLSEGIEESSETSDEESSSVGELSTELFPSGEEVTSEMALSSVELPPDIEEIIKWEHDIETTEVLGTPKEELSTSVGTTHHAVTLTTKIEEPTTLGDIEKLIELEGALEEPSKIVSTSPAPVEKESLTESPSEVVEEILRTLDEFEMSPEVFTESSTEEFPVSSTHGTDVVVPELISGTEVTTEETEAATERPIPESTSLEPTSTSSDIVDEILRTLDQFEITPRPNATLVTEKFRSTHGIDEVNTEVESEAEVPETTIEIELLTSTEPSDIVDEIVRTLGQFELTPEDYTESTKKEFHSTHPEEEISAEVTIKEHETTSEMEILELSTSSEAPSSTPDLVEEILRTLDKFEVSAESYTESMKEESLSTRSEVSDEEVVGTTVTLGQAETTREIEVPDLLTSLLFTEEDHIPTSSVSSVHAVTSSRHLVTSHKLKTTPNLATSPASTTRVDEEEFLIPTSVTEKNTYTHTSSQPEKVKTVKNEQHIESVNEEQDEIETNLAHLPKDRHETSTICEICDQTEENEVSTVIHREFSSEKMLEQADEKYSEEEKIEEEKEEELTSLVSIVHTTERTASVDDGLEEFDANLMHLPKETHETSTICEICDEESSERPGHLDENNARISTKKPEKLKEVKLYTSKHETMTSTLPPKISHKEESEQEEFDSNMHHLPENTRHETSTICEICSEEEIEQFSTSTEKNIVTWKSHQVTEKIPRTSARVETTSELTKHEKLEQEEFESNLHHLPENRVPETSTICEICTEEEEESISQTPYLSKITTYEPSGRVISGEGETTLAQTTIRKNIATVESSKTSVGLDTTSELTNHEKLEQEEFDSNFHHFPEQNLHKTSTICEICTEEEEEISVTDIPSFSKISTTKAPAHEVKSSQSPGESDKGFGFSEELPEGITESSVVTVIEGNLETTKGLTYKFEGEEIQQTMQTTNGNVFKMGQHIPTLEGVTGVESGVTTGFQTEGTTAKYTIEEIGITEALTEIEESTSEGHVSSERPESTADEGLEAAKNIEHKLEETIKIQDELKATEHEELETTISVEEETEELRTTLVEISTQGEFSTVLDHNESHTIPTTEEGLTETTEMPTETNFYTEFKSSVNIELSSSEENFSTHEVSTPEGTTKEMVEVLQEIESVGEKSRTKTEEPYKITTPSSGVSTASSQKEHTILEVTESGLEDLEERGTTHLASDVSALLKNIEDIQEELFISTLGMKDFTESVTVETLLHSTEESSLTESEEKTTWSVEKEETVPMEHGGTSSEGIGMNETVGGAETTLESIKYESEAVSSQNVSEEATSTDFYTQIPSEHFELSTTLESIGSESVSTSRHKGTEEEGSTDFYTEVPSGNFELSVPAGKEETTLEPTESELSSEHKVSEEEASTKSHTPSEHFELSTAAEKEDTTIEYSELETESTSKHKGLEEEASTDFYTDIPSEISEIEVTEQKIKTTHSAQSEYKSSSTHTEGEIASDFYTEIPVVTPELEITKGIEGTSVESIHLETGSTSKLEESEEEFTTEITSMKPGITKGEEEIEASPESTHSQLQTISATKKSEEEDFLELSREMTSESQPVEKPEKDISTSTPSSEANIPEGEELTHSQSQTISTTKKSEEKDFLELSREMTSESQSVEKPEEGISTSTPSSETNIPEGKESTHSQSQTISTTKKSEEKDFLELSREMTSESQLVEKPEEGISTSTPSSETNIPEGEESTHSQSQTISTTKKSEEKVFFEMSREMTSESQPVEKPEEGISTNTPSSETNIPEGEESTHSQSQTISTTKKSEEKDFLELSREMTSESQPVEKPEEHISTGTPTSETHISEGEESTAILSSDILLSENVEKKLEELNKAVNEFLVTTPKKGSIGDLEEIKDQITENLILEKELEELNKEFKEMMQTTLSVEDLIEGLEQTSHSVVKGTLEEFEITTEAMEKTEEITEETYSSESASGSTEHTEIEGTTIVSTEGEKGHEVASTSIEVTTLEEIKENKTELSSVSSPGEKFTTPISFSELEIQPSSEEIGVSEVTHNETSKLFTEYSAGEDVTATMHREVITEKSSSTEHHTTKEQEISTNFYTEFVSESITMSSSPTEEFEGNEMTSVSEEVHHPTEQTLATSLTSSEYALTEGLEKELSEIPTLPSTKEEFTEYSTESRALGDKIEELKKEFEEIINVTISSEEPGMEEEEKIAEENLATVYEEEKPEEITTPSAIPELELTSVSSESFEGLDEFEVTTVHEGQSEKVLSDKIDTKLDELNEIIGEILNATSAPEKHVEGEVDLEEFTESDILEKELEELNKEFEEILQTTLSSEEILEGIREPTETVGENEPKHSTTTYTGITHVATESTKEELKISLGKESTMSSSEELNEATHSMVQGTTEIETTVESESTIGDEVVTEKEISEDMESGTNFYTAIATSSSTETTRERENMEEKSTEVLMAEESATIFPVAYEKSVTDKLEKKLEELDEIINEFLTSTPKIEIVEEALGNEEHNTEEEDFEKELEELKHEFQLMLSTTISPDDLLGAVEDALFPTTEGATTSGGYETSSVAASTEGEIGTEELSHPTVVENNTETSHEGTIGEEGIIHTTMSEAEKHEGTSEGATVETTEGEGPLEVETTGSYELGTEELSHTTVVENNTETSHEETIGVEGITHTTMSETEKPEGTSEGATVEITASEGPSEVTLERHELTTVLGHETTALPSTDRGPGREEESTLEIERPTEITHHIETVSGTAHVSHPSTSESTEFPEKISTEKARSSSEGGGGLETSEVTIVEVNEGTVGKITETETQEVSHYEILSEESVLTSFASEVHEETSTLSEGISTEAEISGTKFPEKKTKVTESFGTEKTVSYSRQSEKVGSTSETTTSKGHVTEGLSSISLLTTLLLSLVTSTTQTPEKNNTVSSQFAPNISGPQNIPKCLVVFITGESPLLPLNGTKWVPSECPRLGEESTTSHALDVTTSAQETTSISTTLESAIGISQTPSDNETLSSTTELVTTTLVPVEDLPEIRTKNYVEDGCAEADFENNNKCFCMLDLTVDHVAVVLEGGNSSKTNNVKCSKFLKVNQGLVMRNDTMAALKRSRRSYLYLKYLNRQRRETVEYNKIDEVLANELTATCTDTTIYSATGGTATIPCVYKDEVIEREHFMKYLWTADGDKTIIFSDRIREATDGALKIAEVAVDDGGNYTCSINRPFGNTDSEHKHYVHELLVIEKPIFKVKSTVMYVTDDTCSLKDGDVVHAYLPKMLEDLLCGIHKRVCKVEMERPSCIEEEGTTYLTVKYVVTLDAIATLVPSISSSECDFNCQMKVMGSLVSLLIKNVETTSVLDVISEIQSFNHTFKPREVKFPTDRSAAEDASLLPKLVIGCPSGFGIQKSTNKICVACPRNTYNSENSSICSPCPRVHYQPKLGSSSCIECKTPFDDKACVGMMFANKTFLILYVGSSIAIVFFLLLCIFCAQNSTQAAFGGTQKKKRAQTPKRRRIGRKDVEDPAEKPLLPKDPSIPKIVKGPKVPPPDF